MRYAVLIHDRQHLWESPDDAQREQLLRDYLEPATAPGVISYACLEPVTSARTLRVVNGSTLVTEGPFAETKEVFGGFYILEADRVEAAVEFASRLPAARMGGSVEVRPLRHVGGES